MENFLGRICKQQNDSETSACWRKKTKQKRQRRWDVALPCLRGMQHSLRHIFVCSTCEMGYLLRAHCGRRSTPLCGHNGGSFQGRGADRPLRPWAARWYSRTKSETKPTHQAERFPQLLHLLCTNIWNRTNRKHEKGGNPIGQAPLLLALSPLVAFLEQLAEVMFCIWQSYKQAAWFHVTKTEDSKRNTEVETNEMDVQEFGTIIAGKHLHKDT